MSEVTSNPDQNLLKQEFKGINGETVKVELGYQGYDVIFEPKELRPGDPRFRSYAFKKSAKYEFIKPIIWLEAKTAPHGETPRVIHKFDPPLKFSVEFSMDIFKGVTPPMVPEDMVIAVLNERGTPIWEPYPTSKSFLSEDDMWIATIAIVEWTSHTCYGR